MVKNVVAVVVFCIAGSGEVFSDETNASTLDWTASAPAQSAILSTTINGWYCVPRDLKTRFDEVNRRLREHRGAVSGWLRRGIELEVEVRALNAERDRLTQAMQRQKYFVAAAKTFESEEAIEFNLGGEKLLSISANDIQIKGWNKKEVRCELKKRVVAIDRDSAQPLLDRIRLSHLLGKPVFDEIAGFPEPVNSKTIDHLRTSDDCSQRAAGQLRYFAGSDVDQITIEGIDGPSRARMAKFSISSEGGDSDVVRRPVQYGELTVFVPQCDGIILRGGRRRVTVDNVAAELTIVRDNFPWLQEAEGLWEVRNHSGNLTCCDVRMQRISGVKGSVLMTFGQIAEPSSDIQRDGANAFVGFGPSLSCDMEVSGINDGCTIVVGSMDLKIADIEGRIDIWNEYGDTSLTSRVPLSASDHRIVSRSGDVALSFSVDSWPAFPVTAVTFFGGVRTNPPLQQMSSIGRSTFFEGAGAGRSSGWRRTVTVFTAGDSGSNASTTGSDAVQRGYAAFSNKKGRRIGLDIVTGAGNISVVRE